VVIEIQLPVNALTQHQTSLSVLIERAASGDTQAFEQIMILTQQRVMAMTWRMLGNDADARDAAQEVYLRVYKHLGRFRQDQDLFAWLYRITVNVCRDFSRKRQNHGKRFLPMGGSAEVEALSLAVDEIGAEEVLLQAQRRQLITRAMATLPHKERMSLILRDLEGLPTDEVARIMKSSPATVRSQISSARKKIRIYCEKYLKERSGKNSHEL